MLNFLRNLLPEIKAVTSIFLDDIEALELDRLLIDELIPNFMDISVKAADISANIYKEQKDRIIKKIGLSLEPEKFNKIEIIIHVSALAALAAATQGNKTGAAIEGTAKANMARNMINHLPEGTFVAYDMTDVNGIQRGMILKLGEVFGRKINKSISEADLGSIICRGLGGLGTDFLVDNFWLDRNFLNPAFAFISTEFLGWSFVELFYNEQDDKVQLAIEGVTTTEYTQTIHTTSYYEDKRKIDGNKGNIIETFKGMSIIDNDSSTYGDKIDINENYGIANNKG
ncbi:MAG: hypothetical protein WBA74_21220, partial [Cyclobacteriaceae bacterium]